jgi:nucleotide-binding universal stress UspA family protein
MSDQNNKSEATKRPRTFLCVVDESEELTQALRFACQRASNTGGRVALIYVIEPAEFQHWMAVGNLMLEEQREKAQETVQVIASVVNARTGKTPIIYIREGKLVEELITLIADPDAGISLLVLGAATGPEGPGPMISTLIQKMAGRLHVPVTIVPGNMTDEDLDAIT